MYTLDPFQLTRLVLGVAAAVWLGVVAWLGFSVHRQQVRGAVWFSVSTALMAWMTFWTVLSQTIGHTHPWTRVVSTSLSGYGGPSFLMLVWSSVYPRARLPLAWMLVGVPGGLWALVMLTHPPSMAFLEAFLRGGPQRWDPVSSPFYLAHIVGNTFAFSTGFWLVVRGWRASEDGPYRRSLAWLAAGLATGVLSMFFFGLAAPALNLRFALAIAPVATLPATAFGIRALREAGEHARAGWIRAQQAEAARQESVAIALAGLTADVGGALAEIATRSALASVEPPSGRDGAALLRALERSARGAERRLAQVARSLAPDAEPVALDLVPLVAALGARVHVDVADDTRAALILGDHRGLQRALAALVDNALDADPAPPTLTLRRVASAVVPATAVGGDVDGRRAVLLEVRDKGPGMAADVRERCLEPYFSARSGHRGLGLLAVVQAIRISGGALDIDSAPGRGTCVRLWFPEADVPAAAGDVAAARIVTEPTVLLLDADAARVELLREMLRNRGVGLLAAADGGTLRRTLAATTFAGSVALCVQRPARGESAALAIATDRDVVFAEIVVVCDPDDPAPAAAQPLTRPVAPQALAELLARAVSPRSTAATRSNSGIS
ncbi:MAG: hypothetical protein RIT45_3483 [Pseudomonadota bacterium]|jgi:signal transduction histidine kinase